MDAINIYAGMNQDVDPKFQEKGTYRFALNAVVEDTSPAEVSVSNELGNTLCANIPYTIIGHILIEDGKFIIFSTDNTDSEIGIFDPHSCSYSTLINTPCLNFNTAHQVKGLFKIIKGCERVIYFTDAYNNYRRINIDSLTSYRLDTGDWDCRRFDYSISSSVPKIEISNVSDGGGLLKIGAYQFSARYLDSDLNPTNFFHVTRPVLIYDEALGSFYDGIDGAINIIASADESGARPLTSKSINLSLENLDQAFSYVQLAVLISANTSGQISESYTLAPLAITGTEVPYLFTGINSFEPIQIDVQDVVIDSPVLERVVAHEQSGGRLYVANLESDFYDYAEFQRSANNITSEFVTSDVIVESTTTLGNSKNPLTTFYKQSFASDEVYAVAIQYIFANGTFSPLFHVPGREADLIDRVVLTYDPLNLDMQHLPSATSYEYWQIYNSAYATGKLGYFESRQDYPSTLDCDNVRIFPTGKVRYHKTPSRRLVELYRDGEITLIGLEFANITYPSTDVVGHRFYVARRTEANSSTLDMGVISGYFTAGSGGNTNNLIFKTLDEGDIPIEYGNFLSPKTLASRYLNGSYFEMVARYENVPSSLKQGEYDRDGGGELRYRAKVMDFNINFTLPQDLYMPYTESIFVSARSQQAPTGDFIYKLTNESYFNKVNAYAFVHSLNDYDFDARHYLAVNKRLLFDYPMFTLLNYVPIESNFRTLTDSQEYYGGDIFISNFRVVDLADIDEQGNNRILYGSMYDNIYVESQINYELRYPGNDCDLAYSPTNDTHTGTLIEYLRDKSADQVSSDV